ncbi:Nuclear transcription factor Y subunit C-3 [Wickerhamomyces ciferrii]|uniref:Nuclear transcription factor Y subunit C-3 n=1 Tax=Wickerhamomyces ciferrii (strain ATCC 14091 / BCRC 22168 / CBS 111 / JCM 3599 / NBRC 0793 / NRRL Y-1031 F-60-10) TaxID=1206466 RepID=K0KJA4_WICCF|nr:Nuclear transcription factor Y subunit C-3 [Wickerhamomyces ciferrii]CCH45300.1 Nuclear transcription factor Y subunit C-3 [Wickerhamomyces ciferrii]
MNEQYNRFEDQYLDQEPAIILDQNQSQRPGYYDSYQQQQQTHQPQQQSQQPQHGDIQTSQQIQQPQEGIDDEHNQENQENEEHDVDQDDEEQQQGQDELETGEGEDFMGDSVFSNVGQGLEGNYKNMMMAYWQETINNIEHQDHDFKNHQLPLARIKKVMKTDEEVRMISAEAPILFAKGCDIFITELTMRAWIHAEENKRRTLQRSDIAAALQKSDMFDFLIDIVPREEINGVGSNVGGSKKQSSRQNSTTSNYLSNQTNPQSRNSSIVQPPQIPNQQVPNQGQGQNNEFQQQYLQQQLLQQQFLNSKNDDDRDDSNYQYNDLNVYENRF